MDNLKVVLMAFLLLAVSSYLGVGEEEEEAAESRMPIINAAKSPFSLSTASDYSWILKVKELLFLQGWPYISPSPNLDFRDEGATEKVKEAVVKSLDKGKATVEDSAKSAAEFAEDAVDKTVKKLKNTFTGEAGAGAEL